MMKQPRLIEERLEKVKGVHIEIEENGPYVVKGKVPLKQQFISGERNQSEEYVDGEIFTPEDENEVALCRCGKSKNKPYCDGSHKTQTDYDLTCTAKHHDLLDGSEVQYGPVLSLTDNEEYCAYGRFCDVRESVWEYVMQEGEEAKAMAIKEAQLCPAGRLIIWDNATGKALEPYLIPCISILEDPHCGVSGPIFVQGGIQIIDPKGKAYEVRNRVTLCRCGMSEHKPFCNGAHAAKENEFHDGLLDRCPTCKKEHE